MAASIRPATTAPVRVAVIGCGHFGLVHASCWTRVERAHLVAVCDVRGDRADAAAAPVKDVLATTDLVDLAGTVDAVSIAVPPPQHVAVARTCLQLGFDVLLEKPFGLNAESAERLGTAAVDKGLVLWPGYVERFDVTFRRMLQLLSAPRHFCATIGSQRSPEGAVDVVLDLMTHDIDHALEIAGGSAAEVVSARGVGGASPGTVARLVFRSGLVADLAAFRGTAKTRRLRLSAQALRVEADLLRRTLTTWDGNCFAEEALAMRANSLVSQFTAFCAAIDARHVQASPSMRAAQVLSIAERIMFRRSSTAEADSVGTLP